MHGFIRAFAAHRIAPNLLMLLMVVSGALVLSRIETRFFPEFRVPVVQVIAPWPGAAAEDVDASLLTPLENELRNVPDLKEMTSSASDGLGLVYLEFPDGTDLDKAAEDTRRYLEQAVGKLPSDSEEPEAQALEFLDEVMQLSLSGDDVRELRQLARQLEIELLQLGVVRVDVAGLPQDRLEVRVSQRQLAELGLVPAQIGAQIAAQNIDVSAGDVDTRGASRLLRSLSQRESIRELEELALTDAAGNFVRLGDVAEIVREQAPDEVAIYFNGRPSVRFGLTRTAGASVLAAGNAVNDWLAQKTLPAGITLTPHKEEWRLVESRLELLLRNGLQGLVLVLALLFLFLRWRVAIWVAAGIPATFMVAIFVLFLLGGSFDMLTMFAFIMTTGIVVDDAIVVGENAIHHAQRHEPSLDAAVSGAQEMFPAIFASTFTTIGSFAPLMIIGGPIGSIIFVIPLVVICVLSAALFECFTVLPGHLASAFHKMKHSASAGRLRKGVEHAIESFQEGPLRRLIILALRYRGVTIVSAIVMLVLSVSLFISGAVKYRFFPGAELNRVIVQADFVAGTPRATVHAYMLGLYDELERIAAEYPDDEILRYASLSVGQGYNTEGLTGGGATRDETASIYLEMGESEHRNISAAQLAALWLQRAPRVAGLESLSIKEESGGPPGEDVNIRISGSDNATIKAASLALQTALQDVPGVRLIKDDMPYGQKQTVFELTSLGRSLNLSVEEIARQLRDAFNGYEVQTFYQGIDEVELRVVLDSGGGSAEDFAAFRVQLPSGETVALLDLVRLSSRRGFDTIQRVNAQAVAHVTGEVDFLVTDANTVLRQIEEAILPPIVSQYGIAYEYAGSQKDEEQTVNDMKTGLLVAALAIFTILAAVFSSWTLPLVIILTAPLGVIGAIIGHWIMDYEMSILSMFGIFTLNGIVINDSIVLVRDYLARRRAQPQADSQQLIVESVCRRFRAIILTSLTTIGGLSPLMFETSTQAQFLIPMAISICFGLAFATLLILFVMPAYLSLHHTLRFVFIPWLLPFVSRAPS